MASTKKRFAMNEEQAKEHIEELRGYYAHLGSFVGVNLFLFMINMVTSPASGMPAAPMAANVAVIAMVICCTMVRSKSGRTPA